MACYTYARMAQNTNETQTPQGQTLLSWEFPSFERHERGLGWYVGATIVGLGLIIYGLTQRNFLLAVIVLLVAVTLVAREYIQPQRVTIKVTEDGVTIGDRTFRFREFATFWLVYEPPKVKLLYLEFKSGIRPSYTIPLLEQNPLRIRTVLQKYIREDLEREAEDLPDRLGRVFKI